MTQPSPKHHHGFGELAPRIKSSSYAVLWVIMPWMQRRSTSCGTSFSCCSPVAVHGKAAGDKQSSPSLIGDDIPLLVLLNVLLVLGGDFDVMTDVVKFILGVILMGSTMAVAVKLWPTCVREWIFPNVPEKPNAKVLQEYQGLLWLIMVMCIVDAMFTHTTFSHILGTYVWDSFMAVMPLACPSGDRHTDQAQPFERSSSSMRQRLSFRSLSWSCFRLVHSSELRHRYRSLHSHEGVARAIHWLYQVRHQVGNGRMFSGCLPHPMDSRRCKHNRFEDHLYDLGASMGDDFRSVHLPRGLGQVCSHTLSGICQGDVGQGGVRRSLIGGD